MTILSKLKDMATSSWLFTLLFAAMVLLVTLTLLSEYSTTGLRVLTLLFAVEMLVAWFSTGMHRFANAMGALTVLLLLCALSPLDIELIEEAYVLVPLLFVMLFPASLWPLAVAPVLIFTYLPSVESHDFADWLEDAVELLVIGSFACVMSYFYSKSQAQVHHFANLSRTDDLTGLGNRKAFREHMARLFAAVSQNKLAGFALVMLDVDAFKRVNDQYGHSGGDQLLSELAARLQQAAGRNIHSYRIGGDEFAVLFELSEGAMAGTAKAETEILMERLEAPYRVFSHLIQVQPSMGIAIAPWDSNDAESLCRNADLALYSAKRQLQSAISFFDASLHQESLANYEIERQLRLAIEEQELHLEYQPKVCMQTGAIKGVEALLRWHSKELGVVSPARFIPIAEANGTIVPIGRWVLREACMQLKGWQQRYQPFFLSVNISMVQVQRDDLLTLVDDVIAETGIDASWLELELTETAVMTAPGEYIDMLQSLKSRGIRIAIDDFGIAYSSLAYLARLPVDTLKVDKSFVDHCDSSKPDLLIVRTIVQLAHSLGLVTVAEGVETDAQRQALALEGVDRYQGYLFARPQPSDQIEALLSASLRPVPV